MSESTNNPNQNRPTQRRVVAQPAQRRAPQAAQGGQPRAQRPATSASGTTRATGARTGQARSQQPHARKASQPSQHPQARYTSVKPQQAHAVRRVASGAGTRIADPRAMANGQRAAGAQRTASGHRPAGTAQRPATKTRRVAQQPHAQRHTGYATTRTGVAPAARSVYTMHDQRRSSRGPVAAAAVAVAILVIIGIGAAYWMFWRSVGIEVNGQAYNARINTVASQFLADNDYFGVKAGNLLSVSGKVLEEGGGDPCAVSINGAEVAQADLESFVLEEGASLTVGDGADTTEPYKEEATEVAPKLEREGTGAIQFVSQWGKPGKKAIWTGEMSGETVDKGVVEEPTNMVVSSLNVKPKGDKKYMALTFDDGPSKYTQGILDILEKYGVKATFFNLGGNVNATSKKVVEAGHEMASHTNSHQNLPKCDRDTLRSEITSAFDNIEQASGVRPQMMRAPYGAFTSTEWMNAGDLISCNVLWNIDTLDWKRPGADVIANTVISNAYNGAIALMHDGGGNREQDIEALPAIIEGLQAEGYELVTVSELMALDDRFPKDVVNGTVKMPEDAVIPTEIAES